MKTTETKKDETNVYFEHRATKKLKVDRFYNEDVVVEKGEVVEMTRTPEKRDKYQYGFDGGRAFALYPAKFIKIFKVTERTVKEVTVEKVTKKLGKVKRFVNVEITTRCIEREEEAVA